MRFIIVEHGAHELANRLWNDLSIEACARELGASVWNLTYLEHRAWGKLPHLLLARFIDVLTRKKYQYWAGGNVKLLPPSRDVAALSARHHTFFFGWLFRNPLGMERHRAYLLNMLAPSRRTTHIIERVLAPHKGKILIGVRLREKPFKGFPTGDFLVSRERVNEIVEEYMHDRGITRADATVIEVSDTGRYDERTGLHLLSRCSVIIGDNSTYSNLAAWMGNVPHVVTTDEPIDWTYYRNKTTYFENKYATFAHGSLRPDV